MDPKLYEQQHVTEIYDQIAVQFDHTRHHSWPSVRHFIENILIADNIKIGDIGCGNGRIMLQRPRNFTGLDNCQSFVDICRQKGLDTHLGSILEIPFKNEVFDYTLCIAVIHHLSTVERRRQAIRELFRITKPHGQILVTVWASEAQLSNQYDAGNLNQSQMVADNQQDRLVHWKGNSSDIKWRYYHFFIRGELEELCRTIDPTILIVSSYEEHGNYGVICEK